MDTSKIKFVDNSKPIPEPILSNVKEYYDKVDVSCYEYDNEDEHRFMRGAQYGYNIAQVFVEDLKELVRTLENKIKEYESKL